MLTFFINHIAGFFFGVLSSLTATKIAQRGRIGSVFPTIDSTPKWYNLRDFAFLRKLRRGDSVTVFARTAVEYARSGDKVEEALKRGVTFKFFLSSHKALLAMNDRDVIKDLNESITAFAPLTKVFADRFVVAILSSVVDNSVTLIERSRLRSKCLVLSLSKSKMEGEKTVAIVRKKASIGLIMRQYSGLEFTPLEVYQLVREYEPSVLDVRKNLPERIIRRLAHLFIKTTRAEMPSVKPHTVQISLTNKCPSTCAMCTHSQLGVSERRPLTPDELQKIFHHLRDMEARTVILSGGEPLLRPPKELVSILGDARRYDFEIGMITSGFSGDGGPVADPCLMNSIQSDCSWVQFSIDSFKPNVYEGIRRRDWKVASRSLAALTQRLADRIQICFTIQRGNIDGLLDGSEYRAFQELTQDLSTRLRVRLKFAHGTDDTTSITTDQVNDLLRTAELKNWGLDYFQKVIPRLFLPSDIADGLPCKTSTRQKLSGRRCFALRESLYIDANGDLYPCCYLFDDNVSASPYRAKYRLGSVFDTEAKTIPENRNTILDAWAGNIGQIDRPMPIEEAACFKCTRFIGFNIFANQLSDSYGQHEKWFAECVQKSQHSHDYWL